MPLESFQWHGRLDRSVGVGRLADSNLVTPHLRGVLLVEVSLPHLPSLVGEDELLALGVEPDQLAARGHLEGGTDRVELCAAGAAQSLLAGLVHVLPDLGREVLQLPVTTPRSSLDHHPENDTHRIADLGVLVVKRVVGQHVPLSLVETSSGCWSSRIIILIYVNVKQKMI